MFVVLLIFGSIIISNMYEDLLNSGDSVIGDGLGSQKAMTYLLLHSPWVLTVFAFFVGIYIFSGTQREGGFDI